MLSLSLPGRVFLCTLPTDMRKSFDALSGLVQQHLGLDPLSGDLFVFRSKRGDRLKLLFWDEDGLVIYYKKQASDNTHSSPFTEISEVAHNLLGRFIATGRMDAASSSGSRR